MEPCSEQFQIQMAKPATLVQSQRPKWRWDPLEGRPFTWCKQAILAGGVSVWAWAESTPEEWGEIVESDECCKMWLVKEAKKIRRRLQTAGWRQWMGEIPLDDVEELAPTKIKLVPTKTRIASRSSIRTVEPMAPPPIPPAEYRRTRTRSVNKQRLTMALAQQIGENATPAAPASEDQGDGQVECEACGVRRATDQQCKPIIHADPSPMPTDHQCKAIRNAKRSSMQTDHPCRPITNANRSSMQSDPQRKATINAKRSSMQTDH